MANICFSLPTRWGNPLHLWCRVGGSGPPPSGGIRNRPNPLPPPAETLAIYHGTYIFATFSFLSEMQWCQTGILSILAIEFCEFFTAVRILIENGLRKISRKSVRNCQRNRRKSCDPHSWLIIFNLTASNRL